MPNNHSFIKKCYQIIDNPYEKIKGNTGNKQYFGYNCLFNPEEIIHAAGFIPVRLFGQNIEADTSDKYIRGQCCEFIRKLTSSFDQNNFNFLKGAVFGFCCDAIHVTSNILENRTSLDIFFINIPAKISGKHSYKYLVNEIKSFKKQLESHYKISISRKSIMNTLKVYQENSMLLSELNNYRKDHPEIISGTDFLAVLSSGYFLPKEAHNKGLSQLLKELKKIKPKKINENKKRVVVSGVTNNNIKLIEWIEKQDIIIVDDDLCEGSRYLTPCIEFKNSIHAAISYTFFHFDLIAKRILSRYCPVKNKQDTSYAELLIKKYQNNCADGIIVLLLKFCDPLYMEYSSAKPIIENSGISIIKIEPVLTGNNFKQIENRLEAFSEKIDMNRNKKNVEKKLPSSTLFFLNDLLTSYYQMVRNAEKNNQIVALTALGFPKNILYAMRIVPIYPQLHAGFQSSRKVTPHLIRDVEGKYDIPHDVCGEVKAMIGSVVGGDKLPFQLPEPKLIISSNCTCGIVEKGLYFLYKTLNNIPMLTFDSPRFLGAPASHTKKYMQKQIKEIITTIEKKFNTKFDKKVFKRAMINDYKIFVLWREVLKLFAEIPAPVDAMDLYLFALPVFIINSNDENVINLLINLYNELFIINKKNKNLKYLKEKRILWDFLPVNHKKNFLKKTLKKYNASIVMSTYLTGSILFEEHHILNFNYPMTKKQLSYIDKMSIQKIEKTFNFFKFTNSQSINFRKESIKKLIKYFNIDGVIIHIDRSCRPISLPQFELLKYIEDELKIPAVHFDADSMDERYFSKAQVSTRIEAFLERLER